MINTILCIFTSRVSANTFCPFQPLLHNTTTASRPRLARHVVFERVETVLGRRKTPENTIRGRAILPREKECLPETCAGKTHSRQTAKTIRRRRFRAAGKTVRLVRRAADKKRSTGFENSTRPCRLTTCIHIVIIRTIIVFPVVVVVVGFYTLLSWF